jgi:hypothetical protein
MNSSDRTKMRRHQAQAAQDRRDADAMTDDTARQQLVHQFGRLHSALAATTDHTKASESGAQ